jgi:exopolyphosphatase/guanosine-5'-triphosphate,3'-diphosphate pyrophosphatase
MSTEERASLPGVSAARAHQLVAGGLVAEAVMDLFDIDVLQMCPWALREGVILEKLDSL